MGKEHMEFECMDALFDLVLLMQPVEYSIQLPSSIVWQSQECISDLLIFEFENILFRDFPQTLAFVFSDGSFYRCREASLLTTTRKCQASLTSSDQIFSTLREIAMQSPQWEEFWVVFAEIATADLIHVIIIVVG